MSLQGSFCKILVWSRLTPDDLEKLVCRCLKYRILATKLDLQTHVQHDKEEIKNFRRRVTKTPGLKIQMIDHTVDMGSHT